MQRLWCRPTLEVHGIAGGYQGPGVKTVVPPAATAILSCRLVPDMRPEAVMRLVHDFVRQRAPDVEVAPEHALAPLPRSHERPARRRDPRRGDASPSDASRCSCARADRSAPWCRWSACCARRCYFLGLSLPEHGYHAPNERFDWRQAEGGILAFASYFARVAAR